VTGTATRDVRRLVALAGLEPSRFLLAVVLGTVSIVSAAGLMGLSGYLICRAAQQPPIFSLTVVLVAIRALALVRPLSRYGERLAGHDLAFRTLGRVRVAVFSRIEPLAPAGLDQYRDGDLLSRMVADIDELQDLVLRVLLPVSIAVPAGLVIVIGVGVVSPLVGALLAIGLLVAALGPPAVAYRLTARARRDQAGVRASLTADLVDVLDAAPELWLNGADGSAIAMLAADDRTLVDLSIRDARGAGWADALGIAATGLTTVAVLLTAAARARGGDLGPLLVAPLALVAMASFEAVVPLAACGRHLPSVLASGRRVLDLAALEPEVVDPSEPASPPGRQPPISLRGVSVRRGRDRHLVLDELDLDVVSGERIVVTGPSGAGKSTVLQLLVRFLERDRGEALLARHDLRDFDQQDVRQEVLLIAQDPHVFDSDLRQNVLFARPDASDDDVVDALRRARLGDWLDSLPDGIDTRVGEGGRSLSGGQRQRLAMARAFLADPSVLLLDEPTAHLDGENAAGLLADLWRDTGDRSVVLVTHGDAGAFAGSRSVEISAPGARGAE
jgi:ATP-binding cassette subfamily C protein CydC